MKDMFTRKDQVNQLFAELRRQGYVALQNFGCCGGCAGHAIATRVCVMSDERRAQLKGAVFYHRQDTAGARECGLLDLRYGPVETREHGQVGFGKEVVGKAVVRALEVIGLPYRWNGNPDETIEVNVGS